MRFTEVGQQLRAYRLESGLRADEIAAQLGVSRAALYRYEKGDVIKLDTIQRLAELLKISPLSLLGISTEYYGRPVAYFERIRQIEEQAEQLLLFDGPVCYLTTGEGYDAALAAATEEAGLAAADGSAEPVLGILAARKRLYSQRRPGIICILSLHRLQRFLADGIAPGLELSERLRRQCRGAAAEEVERVATLIEAEPMGLQFGVLVGREASGGFALLRSGERATLAVNPFRPDVPSVVPSGVAMITAADEAVAAHQRVAEAQWREAVKGSAAAAHLRRLLDGHSAG